MAKIYYLREGTDPASERESFYISVENLATKLKSRGVRFIGNLPPTSPTAREDLNQYRAPSHTLAEITGDEVNGKFTKGGYYLLEDVTPLEASGWLSM